MQGVGMRVAVNAIVAPEVKFSILPAFNIALTKIRQPKKDY
jgi:hypothetical protein